MKKFVDFMFKFNMLAIFLILSSCTSTVSSSNASLSENEKNKIIEHARKFIYTVNLKNISKDDRLFVKEHKPKFNVTYSDDKQGIETIFWRIDESTALRITCTGNLLDKSVPTRLTVMKCLKQ